MLSPEAVLALELRLSKFCNAESAVNLIATIILRPHNLDLPWEIKASSKDADVSLLTTAA